MGFVCIVVIAFGFTQPSHAEFDGCGTNEAAHKIISL